ncbi:Alpha/Beta hydrolase protein [Cladorrhinum samala]|uniref:Kynurenine formamidase n=1 Tax=Cladorrhinum samala TaxID=585594 RepID=A0AAV9HTW3_9PEZI|nr:Alpha/Beta hydrolase protein [Cladorrhinum samala]
MPADDPLSLWSSTPYSPIVSPSSSSSTSSPSTTIGHHKPSVPYLPGPHHPLQTLSVWIPPGTSPSAAPPQPSFIPSGPDPWILYIHGGAWRDPKVTSLSFRPTALSLLSPSSSSPPPETTGVAGLISINYRLSPHPSRPDPSGSNSAAHPDHISDVLSALSFLSSLGIHPRIVVGHSCGATLAFQSIMDPSRWGLSDSQSKLRQEPPPPLRQKPQVLVGVNGLYDLSGFIACPPQGWEGMTSSYKEFVEGAFGPDPAIWNEIGPASCRPGWGMEWVREEGEDSGEGSITRGKGEKGGEKWVVLVQSREDGLVPYDQTERMRTRCQEEQGIEVVAEENGEGWGGHDEAWERGDKLASLLRRILKDLKGNELIG